MSDIQKINQTDLVALRLNYEHNFLTWAMEKTGRVRMTKKHRLMLEQMRSRIKARSPFQPEITEVILRQHFATIRVMVPFLYSKYGLGNLRVLEIGSDYGEHLFFWGEGSEGIEVRQDAAAFTTALGFRTHTLNVEDGFSDLNAESYEAIHTYNLIEHLVSPHVFLARSYRLLKPRGLLAIGHPVVPPSWVRWLWEKVGIRGWQAKEHIAFFTPETMRWTLERAGFEVLEQLSAGFLRVHPLFARWALPWGASCYSICKKREHFRYSPKRLRFFDPIVFRNDLAVWRDEEGK